MGLLNSTNDELATNGDFRIKDIFSNKLHRSYNDINQKSDRDKREMHWIRTGEWPDKNLKEGGVYMDYDVLRCNIGLLQENKDNEDDMHGGNDKPSKYNPLYLLGRGIGYLSKRVDQGFSKSYGGPKHVHVIGYGRDKRYNHPHVEHESTETTGISLGVGLGKPFDTGNKLYNIGINQYHDSDASFIGDGDDPATSRLNIPAIIAARMAGGSPDPRTIRNGINRRSSTAPIRLGNLRDDLGPNG